ncbi:unnamed protein product [Mytilus edulis]|uniref:Death domain-containing protein n=1 Tax=Mytilus edulis TaxID=6550 RepID=A0A8S3TAA3_MYTED|nr:unnamed protein product [Mytilus edulis]
MMSLFVLTGRGEAKEQCEVNCPGLQEGALNQPPSDIELQRFASRCDETTIRELAIHLGMSFQEWEDLRSNFDRIEVVKYRILVNWREKCSGKFSNIAKALTDMDLPTHKLCQEEVTEEKQGNIDFLPQEEFTEEKEGHIEFPPQEEVTEEEEGQIQFLTHQEVTEEKGAKVKFLSHEGVKEKEEGKVKTFLKKLNPFQKKK